MFCSVNNLYRVKTSSNYDGIHKLMKETYLATYLGGECTVDSI